jgi:sulfatase maturation enzyme AslB (radical SAM superfamily)
MRLSLHRRRSTAAPQPTPPPRTTAVRSTPTDGPVATRGPDHADALVDDEDVEAQAHAEDALAQEEARLSGLRRVEVVLTETCNLACDYCFYCRSLDAPLKAPMDPALVRRIVEFTAANAGPDGVEVVLTGGEPLSYWNAVTETVTAFQDGLGSALQSVRLATNGTLVRAPRAQWLAEHGVAVTVALDGLEGVHDAHRVNESGIVSWKRSTRGTQALLDAGMTPDVSMVVTAADAARAEEGIDGICQAFHPGTLHVFAADPPTPGQPWSRPDPEAWAETLTSAEARWRPRGTRVSPAADIVDAMRSGTPMLHSEDGAWGGAVTIDVHGQVAPSLPLLAVEGCHVPMASADLSDPAGLFQRWRGRSPAQLSGCRECSARGLCGNTDMYASVSASGSPLGRDPWFCRMQRHLVQALGDSAAGDEQHNDNHSEKESHHGVFSRPGC